MLQELLRHTDAVILKHELKTSDMLLLRGLFRNFYADCPALFRIFDGIAYHVGEYLLQPSRISTHIGILNTVGAKFYLLLLFPRSIRKHIYHAVYNIQKVKLLLVQSERTRLYPAHVEHLVYEREQMFARSGNLCKAFLHPVRIVKLGARDSRHAYNRVHGCPDVMGHFGKEVRLGTVGTVRRLVGV